MGPTPQPLQQRSPEESRTSGLVKMRSRSPSPQSLQQRSPGKSRTSGVVSTRSHPPTPQSQHSLEKPQTSDPVKTRVPRVFLTHLPLDMDKGELKMVAGLFGKV